MIFRTSSAHEEGGERVYAVSTQEFLADGAGRVRALRLIEVDLADGKMTARPGTERELACDLVLLAMGFTGAEERSCWPACASAWTSAAGWRATISTLLRRRGSSWPATWAGASR